MPTQSKRGNLAIDMVVDVVWVTSFFLLFFSYTRRLLLMS